MGRKTIQNSYWTQEKWDNVNPKNKQLIDEFINALDALDRTNATLNTYRNALQITMIFFMEQCNNKFFIDLKKLDILKLQNYLLNTQKLSSNRVKFIKSALSSLSNFIENYYEDDFPTFRNIIGKIEHPAKVQRREKTFLTKEQVDELFQYLEEKQDWLKLALVSLALESGARKGELFQVKKDCINNQHKEGMYKTNIVRGKGRGKQGKQFNLAFGEQTANYIQKYLEVRGDDDCELLFVSKDKDGKVTPLKPNVFNKYCEKFSKILGVPVYPHAWRATRANLLLESSVPLEKIKSLLHHESSETTAIYVKPRGEEDVEEIFSS